MKPPREMKSYEVTYRDSTVIFSGYVFEAKRFRSAVRKARKYAMDNDRPRWSVYRVQEVGTDTIRFGPFKYDKRWGSE